MSYNTIEIIQDGVFENLISLEVLDLSFNWIKALKRAIFGENCLVNLRVLNVLGNSNQSLISLFDMCISSDRFEIINLSGNNLTDIPESIISFVQRIAARSQSQQDQQSEEGLLRNDNYYFRSVLGREFDRSTGWQCIC